MQKVILLITLFIICTSGKKPEIKLGSIKLFNNQISIKVPAHFEIMKVYQFKKFYTKESMPKIVYSNLSKEIRVAFGAKSISSKEKGIPAMTSRFESVLKKLYPKAKWKNNGVQIINGSKVGYIEYVNKKPEKFYELLFFTSFKGQLLSCIFHAPKKGHRPWKKIANEIMQSLTLKK